MPGMVSAVQRESSWLDVDLLNPNAKKLGSVREA